MAGLQKNKFCILITVSIVIKTKFIFRIATADNTNYVQQYNKTLKYNC